MKALTVLPLQANTIQLDDVPEPPDSDGSILVQTHAVGICGTDHEIISGKYGWAPSGADRLIIGHESLGQVMEAPADSGFKAGDMIMGIVRRRDPVPCPACAHDDWDMCMNGLYTERGIKQRNGYASERFRIEPEFTIKVDPKLGIFGALVEPTSVVAKAWDMSDRVGRRTESWQPRTVLVTGAGPIGLLAALMGVQRGSDIHVLDQIEAGAKPDLVRALGATYHCNALGDLKPDLVIECTGATSVILNALEHLSPNGLMCLAGISSGGYDIQFDLGTVERGMVLGNTVLFGSVNANRQHYKDAADALAKADRGWLEKLVSRRVPLAKWQDALKKQPDDIKVILDFTV
jgi:glucose 1-dehydrogenase